MARKENKNQLLFIAGSGRSGTTFLNQSIASRLGFLDVGEFQDSIDRFLDGKEPCGCGQPIGGCEIWKQEILEPHIENLRKSKLQKRMFGFNEKKKIARGIEAVYLEAMKQKNFGGIVDSSKNPFFAKQLTKSELFDVTIILLVRDPRGVAYSWSSRKRSSRFDGSSMKRFSHFQSVTRWLYRNILTCIIFRNYRKFEVIFYEDLDDEFIDNWVARYRKSESSSVSVKELHHGIGGNPDRLKKRDMKFIKDMGWEKSMNFTKSFIIYLLTIPVVRYLKRLKEKNAKRI